MIKFRISDRATEDGYPGNSAWWYFEVIVCPNRRSYLRTYRRLKPDDDHIHSLAACTFDLKWYDGSDEPDPHVGTIILDATMLDGEVVAHECFHAALQLWRWRTGYAANFGRNFPGGDHEREEQVAWSLGRLVGSLADGLVEAGVWSGA